MKATTRIAALALVAAAAAFTAGCTSAALDIDATAPVMPPGGIILTKQRAPLVFSNQIPDVVPSAAQPGAGMAVGATARGISLPVNMKCGTAKAANLALYYRWLSAGWGDCSIETAARNAGITRIAFADYELFSVLGLYNELTVRVFGE